MVNAATVGSQSESKFYSAMPIAVTIMTKDRKPKSMPEKDPTTYQLITYGWVIFLSCWGGLVSFINKVKKGEARACNFVELIGEIVTAGFAGVLTFWLCEAANFNALITAAIVGISGHMGSRAIYAMEIWLTNKLKNRSPL
ncbi:phage holin family protein [Methylotenera oryzisoli]|nr:phage holin family protein [Methylotenera oryzisoli]